MREDMTMVLNRPRYESATKPPRRGKSDETPTHVLTFLAAVVMGSFRTLVRYVIRFPAKPWYANLSANSTTKHRKENKIRKENKHSITKYGVKWRRGRKKNGCWRKLIELTYDEDCSMPATLCGWGCYQLDEGVALATVAAICHNWFRELEMLNVLGEKYQVLEWLYWVIWWLYRHDS